MPFKRKGRDHFYIQLFNIPGFGNTSQFNTKTSDKRRAQQMEAALREVIERSYTDESWLDVIHALHRHPSTGAAARISIIDISRAYRERTLHDLKLSLSDPEIGDAIEEMKRRNSDEQVGYGLDLLAKSIPASTRGNPTKLTLLRSGQYITKLCMDIEATGLSRNYIRRGVLNAISKLLTFYWGKSIRDQIFSDVNFYKKNDARDVYCTPTEIVSLLDKCSEFAREVSIVHPHVAYLPAMIAHALLTSADRNVILKTVARDVSLIYSQQTESYSGTIFLDDKKTTYRQRTIPIADYFGQLLAPHVQGKEPGDRIYPVTAEQLRYWFNKARDAAGLNHLRFKDLRHQTAIYAERSGMSYAKVKVLLGHASRDMTARYLAHQCVIEQKEIEALANEMELKRRKSLKIAALP